MIEWFPDLARLTPAPGVNTAGATIHPLSLDLAASPEWKARRAPGLSIRHTSAIPPCVASDTRRSTSGANAADPRAQVITAAGQGSDAAIAINADLVEEDVNRAYSLRALTA